jgi:hypothetical protein
MGWRRNRNKPWPGRGPFSYLPPMQRPGWLYGRGACWRLFTPYLKTTTPTDTESNTVPPTVSAKPFMPTITKKHEIQMLEEQEKIMQQQLDQIEQRLIELKK